MAGHPLTLLLVGAVCAGVALSAFGAGHYGWACFASAVAGFDLALALVAAAQR